MAAVVLGRLLGSPGGRLGPAGPYATPDNAGLSPPSLPARPFLAIRPAEVAVPV